MNKTALTLAAVFATASALLPAYAHAADADRINQTTFVRTADLDLTSAKGQSALKARVSAAARKVCTVSGMSFNSDYDRCVITAKVNAKTASEQMIATATAQRAQIAAR
jgi:UrcA family protein